GAKATYRLRVAVRGHRHVMRVAAAVDARGVVVYLLERLGLRRRGDRLIAILPMSSHRQSPSITVGKRLAGRRARGLETLVSQTRSTAPRSPAAYFCSPQLVR